MLYTQSTDDVFVRPLKHRDARQHSWVTWRCTLTLFVGILLGLLAGNIELASESHYVVEQVDADESTRGLPRQPTPGAAARTPDARFDDFDNEIVFGVPTAKRLAAARAAVVAQTWATRVRNVVFASIDNVTIDDLTSDPVHAVRTTGAALRAIAARRTNDAVWLTLGCAEALPCAAHRAIVCRRRVRRSAQ